MQYPYNKTVSVLKQRYGTGIKNKSTVPVLNKNTVPVLEQRYGIGIKTKARYQY
jgi:hypothetical protein